MNAAMRGRVVSNFRNSLNVLAVWNGLVQGNAFDAIQSRRSTSLLGSSRTLRVPLSQMESTQDDAQPGFLAGVIEGFYGPPWSEEERLDLFQKMSSWGLNTYLYAPKDDLKHRAAWREPYSETEAQNLRRLISRCDQATVRFFYGISPGLTIRHSSESDLERLKEKLMQMAGLGCRHFAVLFDDIPDQMDPADKARWGSLARAQAFVANALFTTLTAGGRGARFLFCPTAYCGRMAMRGLGGSGYLEDLGRELYTQVEVLWTGSEIISEGISPNHVREVNSLLRRQVVLWDNLHANDYDGRRFYCGPYDGRPPGLKAHLKGVLLNPNTEFALNYVPLRTFSWWLKGAGEWDSRAAFEQAMAEWHPSFEVYGGSLSLEDVMLFGDCYYLPHRDGVAGAELYECARQLLALPPSQWKEDAAVLRKKAARLQATCARLSDLRDRRLFNALSRRIWELREELDLLVRFIDAGMASRVDGVCASDFHLPGTYRGGMAARLQRLIEQHADGSFSAAKTNVIPDE